MGEGERVEKESKEAVGRENGVVGRGGGGGGIEKESREAVGTMVDWDMAVGWVGEHKSYMARDECQLVMLPGAP